MRKQGRFNLGLFSRTDFNLELSYQQETLYLEKSKSLLKDNCLGDQETFQKRYYFDRTFVSPAQRSVNLDPIFSPILLYPVKEGGMICFVFLLTIL